MRGSRLTATCQLQTYTEDRRRTAVQQLVPFTPIDLYLHFRPGRFIRQV